MRLIVPGFTDSGLILHASRNTFDELLSGGVRIFEQRYALLHAKTAVIDGALSMVGSANLDMRSFLHNNEVNAVVVGSSFAAKLEAVFERDLKDTRELDLKTWRNGRYGQIEGIGQQPVFLLAVSRSVLHAAGVPTSNGFQSVSA